MRWLLILALTSGCASTVPVTHDERALYRDVVTLVRAKARDEWTVDRIAQDEIAPGVMVSACQVAPETRTSLIAWVTAEIARTEAELGGDARTVWLREGRDKDAVADLLELARVKDALATAHAEAERDCPFWLEADPDFIGVQGDANRFVLFLESRGQLGLTLRGDSARFAGGGAGRILLGAGLDNDATLAAGLELGGGGRLGDDDRIVGVLSGAMPVLLRFTDMGRAFDVEVAAVTFLRGVEGWPPGFRAALAYGFLTPRIGGAFSPQAMFWLGYEYHPARGQDAPYHLIGLGTRIGLDIDP